MRKAIFVTLTALVLATFLPATASAQATATGTMAVDINLPDLVILYYFSNVSVDIDATDIVNGGSGSVSVGSGSGSGLIADLSLSDPGLDSPLSSLADVDLTLQNAWAVRALSSDGTVNVTFLANSASLAGTSGSIGINSVTVADGGTTNTSTDPTTTPALITINSPGLLNPATGDLGMALDMSAATSSGAYSGSFTIEASVP